MTSHRPAAPSRGPRPDARPDAPARMGDPEAAIPTPALVVDLDAFGANLDLMAARARDLGVALRPHAKTHRSADVAMAQIARGAVGVCAQTVSEARALIGAGVPDVLVTNEVADPAKARLLARAARSARVGVLVDRAEGAALLSEAASAERVALDVLVEVECGGGRCGAAWGEVGPLARRVAEAPGLRLRGVQAYHGGLQHADEAARVAGVGAIAERLARLVDDLRAAGLAPEVVGGGGTGSHPLEARGPWTEIQPGSYCFMDVHYAAVGGPGTEGFAQALHVLAQVMSRGPRHAVLDAGLKAIAMDSGPPLVPGGLAWEGASDEHGRVADPEGVLAWGERVRLVPGHIDPTVNLHDWLVCVRRGVVEALWPVTARGMGF